MDWVGLFIGIVVGAFSGFLLDLYFDIKKDEGN